MRRNAAIVIAASGLPRDPAREVKRTPVSQAVRRARVVERALNSTPHALVKLGGTLGWRCATCARLFLRKYKGWMLRLRTPCTVADSAAPPAPPPPAPIGHRGIVRRRSSFRASPAPRAIDEALWVHLGLANPPVRLSGEVVVSGSRLHSSHLLWRKGAYTFCSQCGHYCALRPRLLRSHCDALGVQDEARLKPSQRAALHRLRQGLPPAYGISDWGFSPA